jgi:hypothetical protein
MAQAFRGAGVKQIPISEVRNDRRSGLKIEDVE